MIAGQYGDMMQLLTEIRDRLPAPVESLADKTEAKRKEADAVLVPLAGVTRDEKPVRTPEEVLAARMPEAVALGHRQALSALLRVLDDWIGGARENHVALEHRGESRGSECWTRFHPQDIRHMVNDAAREVGVPEFAPPLHPCESIK